MEQVGDLIQDQNLNVHSNGASAGGKINVSKAPRKGAVSRRKPVGDLDRIVNTKVSVVSEDDLDRIAEAGFHHNHEECIKCFEAQIYLGFSVLHNIYVFTNRSVPTSKMDLPLKIDSPLFGELKPASPPRYMEREEMPDRFLWEYEKFRILDFQPQYESPDFSILKSDNFVLEEPPKLKMKWA